MRSYLGPTEDFDPLTYSERNQYGIVVSGVPPRGRNRRTIYKTPVFILDSKQVI